MKTPPIETVLGPTPRTDEIQRNHWSPDGEGDYNDMVVHAKRLELELAEARAELAKHQWQPIETAPKDTTVVEVCANGGNGFYACKPVTAFCWEGEWVADKDLEPLTPTHWRPLSDPPTEKLSTGDNDLG